MIGRVRAAALALACVLALVLAGRRARADTPEPTPSAPPPSESPPSDSPPTDSPPSEPPPEAGEGDYTLESRDSLDDEEFQVSVAASGGSGAHVRRSQRLSFRGGGARGTLREGDDALAGGRVQAPLAGGTLAAGRLAPRWARGLVLGGAAEPWSRSADDRGEGAAFRGRAGDGVAFETRHGALLSGRFHRLALMGGRWVEGRAALGVLAARHGAQASAGWEGGAHATELAFDSRGRWRAETALTGDAGETRLALRVRGGLGAFRPLAEPARAGPPQALAASASRVWGALHAGAFGALWKGPAGQVGARGALEVAGSLGRQATFAAG